MKNKLYSDYRKKLAEEKQYKHDKKERNTLLMECIYLLIQCKEQKNSTKWY